MSDDPWIRRFHPGPERSTRLVCLPHAGGSASFYHPLSAALAAHTETLTIQYPGRQDRRAERPIEDLTELADRVSAAVLPWADRPLVLFGHSMGALLAYEVARRLEERVSTLVVSGRRAPSIDRPETVHLRDDAGVLDEVKRLAGTDERLLGDEELLRMILPAIRADYSALATYRYDEAAAKPIDCPIRALVGDVDPVTSLDDAGAWAGHTTGDFRLRVFPGGHFYLADHQAEIASLLAATLKTPA